MRIPHFGLDRQYYSLGRELLEASHNALSSGILVSGKYTSEFEKWLAKRTGALYAVTVHSGTQALEIIARYKMAHFKEVYDISNLSVSVPNLTYPATLNAFLNTGWNVELVDTDRNGIVPLVEQEDNPNRTFNCRVGLYGAPPPVSSYRFDTYFDIIDGAQHWLVPNGDIGSGMAISFDPTKNLPSSGNGGAIITDDIGLYSRARDYRDNGKVDAFAYTGTNSKMSEQDCAQILVRTRYIDQWQARRAKIAQHWCTEFSELPLRCLSAGYPKHAHQKFVIYSSDRSELTKHLIDHGIDIKIHYEKPLSELPISKNLVKPDFMSVSSMLSKGVFSLPMYPELTDNEVEYITSAVKGFYKTK